MGKIKIKLPRLCNIWHWISTPYRKVKEYKRYVDDYGVMSGKYMEMKKKVEQLEFELWRKDIYLKESSKIIEKLRKQ